MKFKPFSLAFWSLLGLGVALGALRQVGNLDLWFQLLAGRFVLDNGAIPRTEFFLYFLPEPPQQFGGWGFGTLFELAIRSMGFAGASLLNMLIWGLAFGFAVRAALIRTETSPRGLSSFQALALAAALALCFGALSYRMAMRAESTLILAWMFALWLFEWSKSRGKIWIFQLALPVVGWAEAMLHTGGFLLLALVPICALRDAPQSWRDLSWWGRWIACGVGLLLLPIANPNGVSQVYIQAISAIEGLGKTSQQWQLRAMIGGQEMVTSFSPWEYRPLWDPRAARLIPMFALAAIACVMACCRKSWRRGWFESLVCIVFLLEAVAVSRAIAFAAMAALVPAMEAALALGRRYEIKRQADAKWVGAAALSLCLAPALFGYMEGAWGMSGNKAPESGLVEKVRELRPEGARIFAKENGPMLAYLLGHDKYKVAYGAHYLTINQKPQEHYIKILLALGDWESELEKERVDLVCVPPYMVQAKEGEFFWLPSMLAAKSDWRMWVVSDSSCLLFEKLPASKVLSAADVLGQKVVYLSILRQYRDAPTGGAPDLVAREMSDMAAKRLRSIRNEVRAESGVKLRELPPVARWVMEQLDKEDAKDQSTLPANP